MYKEIKDALFLFVDKTTFNLTYLKNELKLSDDHHQKLTAYLLNQKLIHQGELWGREYKYELSDLGKEVFAQIKTYEATDRVLGYFAQNPNGHFLNEASEKVGVPANQRIGEILLEADAIVPFGAVKEGTFYKITDAGKNLSESGGLTAKYKQSIEAEFAGNVAPTPTNRTQKSMNKHDDMLLHLYEMNTQHYGKWVDLLAYYSNDEKSIIREIANDLEEKKWIKIMPVGVVGSTLYSYGEKPVSVTFPNPLKAKITYDGTKHVEQMQKPPMDTTRTVFTGPLNITHGANSPITSKANSGYAVDNSETKTVIEQPKDREDKKESTWKKWVGGATIIGGLVVALYKALEAMHVI